MSVITIGLYIPIVLSRQILIGVSFCDHFFVFAIVFLIIYVIWSSISLYFYYKKVSRILIDFSCYRIRSYLYFGCNCIFDSIFALMVKDYFPIVTTLLFISIIIFLIEMISYLIGLLLIPVIYGKDSIMARISYMKKIFKNEPESAETEEEREASNIQHLPSVEI